MNKFKIEAYSLIKLEGDADTWRHFCDISLIIDCGKFNQDQTHASCMVEMSLEDASADQVDAFRSMAILAMPSEVSGLIEKTLKELFEVEANESIIKELEFIPK